jgi:hypothetical protein
MFMRGWRGLGEGESGRWTDECDVAGVRETKSRRILGMLHRLGRTVEESAFGGTLIA